jgi:excisionase family DNA binding protein
VIDRHYTTAELAELLSVHPETIRRAARRGELGSIRVGLDRRYPTAEVVKWLEKLRVDAA